MKLKKCPVCELNYIEEGEDMCNICKGIENEPHLVKPHEGAEIFSGRFFFVFQGKSFELESREGYVWAPKYAGVHHWDRVREIKVGDCIIHAESGYIRAISFATSQNYDYKRDGVVGRRVDCKYYLLKYPIRTKTYYNEILQYRGDNYPPFNKKGNGNMGYLYNLTNTLATVFIEGIIKYNPYLKALEKSLTRSNIII